MLTIGGMNGHFEPSSARTGFLLALCLTAVVAATMVFGQATPASAASTEALNFSPPTIVLKSVAGAQRATQGSYCISVPTSDSFVVLCADYVDPEPRWLSIVRPKEHVTIRVRGATMARGSVWVHPRGCERRVVQRFKVMRPTRRWLVRLDPGRYELSLYLRFRTADGRSGDTSGALGLLVSKTRVQDVIAANDSLAC
jgi:hypothetical protein